jgi:superfamily II DNA or RNA helicase
MSIKTNVFRLSDDQKTLILNDLEVETKKKNQDISTRVYPYHVEDASGDIVIAYAYARSTLCLSPPSRDSFPDSKIEFTGALRPYQKQVKHQAIAQLNKTGVCLLALHVGWGKSTFAVYLASKLHFKTIIVLNRLVLVNQWKEEISKNTLSKCQLIKPNQAIDPSVDFYIINAINIPKFERTAFTHIGTVIIDEIHLIMAEKMFTAMHFLTPKYMIGLSATPYRPDGLDKLLTIYCGEDRIIEKLNKKHTVYAIHTRIRIQYDLQADGRVDWNSVLNNQAQEPKRNELIIDIIKRFPHLHFLVLCKRIHHGNLLVSKLQEEKEYVTEMLGTSKSFDENARILVATSQKCGVGFSHNKLNALIIASDMEEYFIQYLGRVFRNPNSTPVIFDLIDTMPILYKHFKTRKTTYEASGGTVIEMEASELSSLQKHH